MAKVAMLEGKRVSALDSKLSVDAFHNVLEDEHDHVLCQ